MQVNEFKKIAKVCRSRGLGGQTDVLLQINGTYYAVKHCEISIDKATKVESVIFCAEIPDQALTQRIKLSRMARFRIAKSQLGMAAKVWALNLFIKSSGGTKRD